MVFVSSTAFTDASQVGDVSDANLMCEVLATAAMLSGAYQAWMSDGASSPATDFTFAAVPYVLVDGTTIADDQTDLLDGNLAAPINLNEQGMMVNASVWTGTNADGTLATNHCVDWTSAADTDIGQRGVTTEANGDWTSLSDEACDEADYRIYCFQQ